jgi:hypothetical protein
VPHTLVYQSTNGVEALFECSDCGREIAFVIPGLGEPAAVPAGDGWAPPEGAEYYLEACEDPVTPSVAVPQVITKRQFLIQLLRSGMVAPEEVATLATQPPALMQAVLASMATEQSLEAQLGWAAMTQVERNSELVLAAAQANNISEETLDAFFIAAGEI